MRFANTLLNNKNFAKQNCKIGGFLKKKSSKNEIKLKLIL